MTLPGMMPLQPCSKQELYVVKRALTKTGLSQYCITRLSDFSDDAANELLSYTFIVE